MDGLENTAVHKTVMRDDHHQGHYAEQLDARLAGGTWERRGGHEITSHSLRI